MLSPYNPDYRGNLITGDNVLKYTGYSFKELFMLTGVSPLLKDSYLSITPGNYDYYPSVFLNLEMPSNADIEPDMIFERRLHLQQRTMYNQRFILKNTGSGLGTNIFASQVKALINAGIQEIKVRAFGNYKTLKYYNGYITWGKLGFVMEKESHRKFCVTMRNAGRIEPTLNDLLLTDKGYEFWKNRGFTWSGKFDLTNGSESRTILNNYLKRKGYDIVS